MGQNWTGFNGAAFIVSGIWLPYRRMYSEAFTYWAIAVMATIGESIVFGENCPPGLRIFLTTTVAVICGVFGNQWYWAHARKAIERVRSQGLSGDHYFQALARRGGTSVGAAIAFPVGSVLLLTFGCVLLSLCG